MTGQEKALLDTVHQLDNDNARLEAEVASYKTAVTLLDEAYRNMAELCITLANRPSKPKVHHDR